MEVLTKYFYASISTNESIENEKVHDLIKFKKHVNKTS